MSFGNIILNSLLRGAVSAAAPMPRFPRASRWAGDLALAVLRSCRWLAIPVGPLKIVPSYFVARKARVERAMMPVTHRVLAGLVEGLFEGLYEAVQKSAPR